MTGADVCYLDATELAALIARGDLSAVEATEAHLARIAAVNPRLNAIVTLDPDGALAQARRADDARRRGDPLGPLHGLPVAHKDLFHTRGMRTTLGSPLFRDWVPEVDSIIVERQRAAGAITLGKTNTPEFGAGSQTFNTVFGATRNPYDETKTCGGSSGGAAVALATGMVALADGSDLGGSLRNPANFCNVVGLRPSIGRVPQAPSEDHWATLSVSGPMARTVADVALFLGAIAGEDARDPVSIAGAAPAFAAGLGEDVAGMRVAWSPDLGGLPVEPEVRAALATVPGVFASLGCDVDEAAPDFTGADEAFQTQRGILFANAFGPLLDRAPEALKDTVVWNIRYGRERTGAQVGEAVGLRSRLYARMHAFMERYDVLVCPV
ncbi:MAG TPA: amidase family protein, partial [Candidatus Elarobacter sp.]